jgi:hypothetical protein
MNLGIFLNNTNSEIKYNINLVNFNNLKNNFDKIILVDIDNEYSNRLNTILKSSNENIVSYNIDNKYVKDSNNDFEINLIVSVLNNIDCNEYNYLTFINDNYIYIDSLKNYFDYVIKHKLEFYSYSDSTEHKYHYQLYLFSIQSNSVCKLLLNKDDNNLLFKIHDIFESKMPFLKIAYLKCNLENNIFYNFNKEIYKRLLKKNLLPVININSLYFMKNNFKDINYVIIPDDFDINIYKTHDLKDFNDEEIVNHFINHGQYEFRLYKKNNTLYPDYIRNILKKNNILEYFDVPDDFNLLKYREKNEDLINLSIKQLILHWINYGFYEKRDYK